MAWWNVFGFVIAMGVSGLRFVPVLGRPTAGVAGTGSQLDRPLPEVFRRAVAAPVWLRAALLCAAALIFLICMALDRIAPV